MKNERTGNMLPYGQVDSQSSGSSNLYESDKIAIVSAGSSAEFRCNLCQRLLAKMNRNGALAAEIKCPRCGTINDI